MSLRYKKKKHAARFFILIRLSKSLARSTLVFPRGDAAPLREMSFFHELSPSSSTLTLLGVDSSLRCLVV